MNRVRSKYLEVRWGIVEVTLMSFTAHCSLKTDDLREFLLYNMKLRY